MLTNLYKVILTFSVEVLTFITISGLLLFGGLTKPEVSFSLSSQLIVYPGF